MEEQKIVPNEHELKAFDLSDPQVVDLIHHAQESDAADRLLTVRQALKKYKKAVFWAMILSTSLVMEGYDLVIVRSNCSSNPSFHCAEELLIHLQINSFYGQRQFQDRFGVDNPDPTVGGKLITPAWQSGLSNSAVVGQLAGLVINSYAQDRFGCRITMMAFMTWLTLVLFIPVFAPSLSILALGEALCGIPWGVFQVRLTCPISKPTDES
jgi:SP family general alpha glucoside:H+ symporter-like MFS transporter